VRVNIGVCQRGWVKSVHARDGELKGKGGTGSGSRTTPVTSKETKHHRSETTTARFDEGVDDTAHRANLRKKSELQEKEGRGCTREKVDETEMACGGRS